MRKPRPLESHLDSLQASHAPFTQPYAPHRYPLAELMDACRYYCVKSGRRITFEWALIAGQNDSVAEAGRLADLLHGMKSHVNIIPLNPTKGFAGQPASLFALDQFVAELTARGISASVRVRRGIDIDAGCGQLADARVRAIERGLLANETSAANSGTKVFPG